MCPVQAANAQSLARHLPGSSAQRYTSRGFNTKERETVEYYLYMGLMAVALFLWAVIALKDDQGNTGDE